MAVASEEYDAWTLQCNVGSLHLNVVIHYGRQIIRYRVEKRRTTKGDDTIWKLEITVYHRSYVHLDPLKNRNDSVPVFDGLRDNRILSFAILEQ